jgi:hypothetical protein
MGESEEIAGAKNVWMAVASREDDVEREFTLGFEIAGTLKRGLFILKEEKTSPPAGSGSAVFEVGCCWLFALLDELSALAPGACGVAGSALDFVS